MPFHEPPPSMPRQPQTLGWAIMFTLVGVMVVGALLLTRLGALDRDVNTNRETGWRNRAVTCQATIDQRLPLPADCRDPHVMPRLDFGG